MSKLFQSSQSIIVGYGHPSNRTVHSSWKHTLEEIAEVSSNVDRISSFKFGPVFNGRHGKVLEKMQDLTGKPLLYAPKEGTLTKEIEWGRLNGLVLDLKRRDSKELVATSKKNNVEPIAELKKENFLFWEKTIKKGLRTGIKHFLLHRKKTSYLQDTAFLDSCIKIFKDKLQIRKPDLIIDFNSPNLDPKKVQKAAEGTNWHIIVRKENLGGNHPPHNSSLENFIAQLN